MTSIARHRSWVRLGLIALLLVCTSGCGTFINLSTENAFYGGVSTDLAYAADPPLPQDDVGWFWTFDLPFSFVLDTALIPMYAMAAIFREVGPAIEATQPEGTAAAEDREPSRRFVDRPPTGMPTRKPPPKIRAGGEITKPTK